MDIAIEMKKERRYLGVDEAFKGPVRRSRSLSPLQAATHPLVYAVSLCTLWIFLAASLRRYTDSTILCANALMSRQCALVYSLCKLNSDSRDRRREEVAR